MTWHINFLSEKFMCYPLELVTTITMVTLVGIWPESPSFSDTEMPPIPAGWKGRCQPGEAFNFSTCNRFVILCTSFTLFCLFWVFDEHGRKI